jgi:hypothetical protein
MRFEVLTAVRMTLLFLWVVHQSTLVCSLEDGDRMFLRNVGINLRVYMASQPVRSSTINLFFKQLTNAFAKHSEYPQTSVY